MKFLSRFWIDGKIVLLVGLGKRQVYFMALQLQIIPAKYSSLPDQFPSISQIPDNVGKAMDAINERNIEFIVS